MTTGRWTTSDDMNLIKSLAEWFNEEFKKETGCEPDMDDFIEFIEGHPNGVNWTE